MPQPSASTTIGGSGSIPGAARGCEEAGEAARPRRPRGPARWARRPAARRRRAWRRAVPRRCARAAPASRPRPSRPLGLPAPRRRSPRGRAGELLEGGEEGLLLAVEVLVEGLVGGARGRGDRGDRQVRVADLGGHLGGGADDPLALGEIFAAAGAVGRLVPVESPAGPTLGAPCCRRRRPRQAQLDGFAVGERPLRAGPECRPSSSGTPARMQR